MDNRLNQRMAHILTIFITGSLIVLLLHTPNFSVGLLLFACFYLAVLTVRNYWLKVDLRSDAGALAMTGQLVLALILAVWSESFIAQTTILILIGEFAFFQSRNRALVFAILGYFLSVAGVIVYRGLTPLEEIYYILPRVIEYLAIYGMSLLAKIAFQQKNQLALDNELLRQASIALERKAKLQERTRISREIHDSVGHALTSALTGLQTAAHAIDKGRYPLAQEMIGRTKDQIVRGLNDVRSSVHLLRENLHGQPFIPELTRLIDETTKQTDIRIDCRIDDGIPELPPKVELTIYRALQEGLTNGMRHGACTSFHFSLTTRGNLLLFKLEDNGTASKPIVPGFGLGVMKERVEEVGGELTVSNKSPKSGVTLEIAIPLTISQRTE